MLLAHKKFESEKNTWVSSKKRKYIGTLTAPARILCMGLAEERATNKEFVQCNSFDQIKKLWKGVCMCVWNTKEVALVLYSVDGRSCLSFVTCKGFICFCGFLFVC